jgi:TPR repeat protein
MTDGEIENLACEAMQREDFVLAERLFKSLKNGESEYTLVSLGFMHVCGYLGAPNNKIARRYFKRAMAIGSANAHLHMASLLAHENKLQEALEIIDEGMKIDNNDYIDNFIKLKSITLDNIADQEFERKNYQKAFMILKSQMPPESEYTLLRLGWLYQTGVAGIKDKTLARLYCQRAGKLGSIEAHFQIGMIELSQNNSEAARAAFQEGARLEHLPSTSQLAEMMIEGQGGSVEIERGMRLLIYCAERGHILSKVRLLKIDINATHNIFVRAFKRLKYITILIEMRREISRGSRPSNYYEFRR